MTIKEIATICMEWKYRINDEISMSDWLYLAIDYNYDIKKIEKLADKLYQEWHLEHYGKPDDAGSF